MTALALMAVLVAAAKYVECRRLKQRIVRFEARERAYRRMGKMMALTAFDVPADETSRLVLVEDEAAS